MTWLIIELSRNPRVLQLLQVELDQAFQNPDDVFDQAIFLNADLPYLEKVIKENMRLNPVTAKGLPLRTARYYT